MRKWGAEHPVLLAAIVLTLTGVAIFGAKLALGDPVDDAAFSAFFWLIVLGLSWFFTSKRLRNTADRLAERGQVLAYIRYPTHDPVRLAESGTWGWQPSHREESSFSLRSMTLSSHQDAQRR